MKNFSKIVLTSPQRVLFDLAQHSNDVVIITDWGKRLLYMNPAGCRKTGYTREFLADQNLSLLYRPEVKSTYIAKIFRDLGKRGQWAGEVELRRRDGSTFWTNTTVIAYYNERGKPAGTIGIGRDLTTEKLLSQHAMEDENRLQQIIEAMEDAVCVCDAKGKILMVNSAHSRMLGRRKDEIIGIQPPYPWIDLVDLPKAKDMFRRVMKKGSVKNIPLTWRRSDNRRMIVSIAMSRYTAPAQCIEGQVCTIRDITNVRYSDELRKAEEQVQRLVFDIKQKSLRLHTLEETNNLVLHQAGISRIFSEIITGVKNLVQHDLAGIYVYDAQRQSLLPHTLSKQTSFSRKLAKFPVRMGKGIIGEAAASGKMALVNNAHLDPRSTYPDGTKPDCEHFIAVPLKGNEMMFGVLVVARNRNPQFIEEEAVVVKSFADAACVAIEHARLVYQLGQEGISSLVSPDILDLINGKSKRKSRDGFPLSKRHTTLSLEG